MLPRWLFDKFNSVKKQLLHIVWAKNFPPESLN